MNSQDRLLKNREAEEQITQEKPGNLRLLWIVLSILVFISLSEYLSTSLETVQIGLIGHGIALLTLLLLSALVSDQGNQRVFLTLAFAPLIRLVSLSLPLQNVPRMYWYLIVGLLIFIAVYFVIRYGQFTMAQAGLIAKYWFLQLLFGLVGIGLGYVEYLILRPDPLVENMTLGQIWFPSLVLIIFTGVLEEVVFRGLMQSAFAKKIGRWLGILLISILFAVLHLGYQSLLDVVFVFGVALLFAIFTELTGSIIGASIAHGLTNVALFLIFPFIIGQGINSFSMNQFLGMQVSQASSPTPIVAMLIEETNADGVTETLVPTSTVILSTTDEILTATPSPMPSATSTTTSTPTFTPTIAIAPIIVDDGDTGFFRTRRDRWLVEQGYNGSLVWSFTRFDEPDVLVIWTPDVEICGNYRFEVFIPEDYGQAQAIQYEIIHRDGSSKVIVDQSSHQGEWVSLGEFWCDVGTGCQVLADNYMDDEYPTTYVAYDALRLTYLDACE